MTHITPMAKKYFLTGVAVFALTAIFYFLAPNTDTYSAFEPLYPEIHQQSIILIFELENDQVTLLKATKIDQEFKKIQKKEQEVFANDIKYEIRSDRDRLLHSGLVSDPTIAHYDYFDDQENIDGGSILNDSAIFIVKSPYLPDIDKIEFTRLNGEFLSEEPVGLVDLSQLQTEDQIVPDGSFLNDYDFNVTKIVDMGNSADMIDIVIMGDGYTASEIATTYYTHVELLKNKFLATEPYSTYSNLFNIWRIDVISNESGADSPNYGVYYDTVLDATYGSKGYSGYLTIDSKKAVAVAELVLAEGGDYDIIAVPVNDIRLGGSAGSSGGMPVTTYGASNESYDGTDNQMHEFSHGLGDLDDEYGKNILTSLFYPSICLSDTHDMDDTYVGAKDLETDVSKGCVGKIDRYPNVTAYTKIEHQVIASQEPYKWSYWFDLDDRINNYEGARYVDYGLFRPAETCKMKHTADDLCPVCQELIIKRIWNYHDPNLIKTYLPDPNAGIYNLETNYFYAQKANVSSVEIEWLLDGEIVLNKNSVYFDIYGNHDGVVVDVEPGQYTLTARMYDGSPWIKDPNGVTQEITWQVMKGDSSDTTLPTINGPYRNYYKSIERRTFDQDVAIWWEHSDDSGIDPSTVKFEYQKGYGGSMVSLPLETLNENTGSVIFPAATLESDVYYIKISLKDNAGNYLEIFATVFVNSDDTTRPRITTGPYHGYFGKKQSLKYNPIFDLNEPSSNYIYWTQADEGGSGIDISKCVWQYRKLPSGSPYNLVVDYVDFWGHDWGFITPFPTAAMGVGQYELVYGIVDKAGNYTSNWQDPFIITVIDSSAPIQPNVPTPPANLITADVSYSSIKWSWDSSSQTDNYEYHVYQGANCYSQIDTGTTVSTERTQIGLSDNTTYSLRVKACNSDGCSNYSSCKEETTQDLADPVPDPPFLYSPTNGSIVDGITYLKWNPGNDNGSAIDKYHYQTEYYWNESWHIFEEGDTTNQEKYLHDLGSGNWRWHVRAHNQIGWGNYSSYWQFSVPHTPVVNSMSPTSGPVNTTVTLTGNYFGSSQGSDGSVELYNKNICGGGIFPTIIPTSIISWSNTQIRFSIPSNIAPSSCVVWTAIVQANGVYRTAIAGDFMVTY